MPRLIFDIVESLAEIKAAAVLTAGFIDNPGLAFGELATQLENIRDHRTNATIAWTIAESRPIRTKPSAGEYERSGRGPTIVGTLSSIWEIKRVPPPKAKAPAKYFELVGNASTVIRLFRISSEGTDEEQVAMWRMEIGQDDSPGCHFHVQVLGDSEAIPFPRSLSIPRLPTVIATPPAVLEFLLAELFQERWRKHLFSENSVLQRWRGIQRGRLTRLLAWQTQQLTSSTGSPWCTLKAAKPAADLFTA